MGWEEGDGGGLVLLSLCSGILSVLSVEFLCVCLLSVKNGSFFLVGGWVVFLSLGS